MVTRCPIIAAETNAGALAAPVSPFQLKKALGLPPEALTVGAEVGRVIGAEGLESRRLLDMPASARLVPVVMNILEATSMRPELTSLYSSSESSSSPLTVMRLPSRDRKWQPKQVPAMPPVPVICSSGVPSPNSLRQIWPPVPLALTVDFQ